MFKIIESVINNKKVYGVVKGNHAIKDVTYSRVVIENLIKWLNSKSFEAKEIYAAVDGYFMAQEFLEDEKED